MRTDVELWQAAVSLVLIAIVVAVSLWRNLGLERWVLWASARATAQLLAVGAFFAAVFDSRFAGLWSGLWVAGMIGVASGVVARRTGVGRHDPPRAHRGSAVGGLGEEGILIEGRV